MLLKMTAAKWSGFVVALCTAVQPYLQYIRTTSSTVSSLKSPPGA